LAMQASPRNPHRLVDNELRTYFLHVKGLLDKNEFEDDEGNPLSPESPLLIKSFQFACRSPNSAQ